MIGKPVFFAHTNGMPLVDHLLSVRALRRSIWRLWYPYLTRRLQRDDVLFLNYAFDDERQPELILESSDEANRGCIQLYHHVGSQVSLRGRNVLEVSCGHGGGASYLTRMMGPSQYVGLDLNPQGIHFCRARHSIDNLTFINGDAEALPFPSGSFDVVVNVEASHCYPRFARFLQEVHRVLRPQGHLLYADFRFASGLVEWERDLSASALRKLRSRIINTEVLRGMERNSARSAKLIEQHLPGFLHSLGRDFAGVVGSRIHEALRTGTMSYRSYCFERPAL
jgi:ubiquinone/menaquinone biosynthesis C-methylase UbiE